MIKAVIFDNDGVIINSEPMHIAADLLTLAACGVHWTPEQLHRFIGVKDTDMWIILQEELGLTDSLDALNEKKMRYREVAFSQENIVPIPGIPALFAFLHTRGLKIAVASSSARTLISPWLQSMGLLRFLDAFVTSEDVTRSKPDPEPYLKVAALLCLKPEECLAVEDSSHGLLSARRAGCYCVGFRTPGEIVQDLSLADVVVDSILDIQTMLLQQWNDEEKRET